MFTLQDILNVRQAHKQGLAYYVGKRIEDGKEYCVVIANYSKPYMMALTPLILHRIAVY